MPYGHKQVKIQYGNLSAEVDEGIAELILACWKCGIKTTMSCQENFPGVAWLYFFDSEEALTFLSIAAGPHSDDEESLYYRVKMNGYENKLLNENKSGQSKRYKNNNGWDITVCLNDMAVNETLNDDDEIETEIFGPTLFTLSLSVRFPVEDIPEIIANLNSYSVEETNKTTETLRQVISCVQTKE